MSTTTRAARARTRPRATKRWKNAARVRFNIETKTDPREPETTKTPGEFVQAIGDRIMNRGHQDRADLQSFDLRTLFLAQVDYPLIRKVVLFGDFGMCQNPGSSDAAAGRTYCDDSTNLQPLDITKPVTEAPNDGNNTPWWPRSAAHPGARGAAAAIGAASVELLGYDDSGMDGRRRATRSRAPTSTRRCAAAAILRREKADVLTIYDANGGYGHPDHIQVHHVGVRAAQLAGTPAVLEATIDRDLLRRALRVMRAARLGAHIQLPDLEQSYTPRSELTHRIDVRRQLPAKRAALLAHASQATADDMDRTIAFLLRLPPPLFRLVLGSEWFVQRNAVRPWPLANDIFTALEGAPAST